MLNRYAVEARKRTSPTTRALEFIDKVRHMAGWRTGCVIHSGCVAGILMRLRRRVCEGLLRFYPMVSFEEAALV
jgi:hypothetical protein